MENCNWVAYYKVKISNLVEHDDPDAEAIALDLLREDSIMGLADWPDDFELIGLKRDTGPATGG